MIVISIKKSEKRVSEKKEKKAEKGKNQKENEEKDNEEVVAAGGGQGVPSECWVRRSFVEHPVPTDLKKDKRKLLVRVS